MGRRNSKNHHDKKKRRSSIDKKVKGQVDLHNRRDEDSPDSGNNSEDDEVTAKENDIKVKEVVGVKEKEPGSNGPDTGAKGNLHGANGQEAGAQGNLHGAIGHEAGAQGNLHGANGQEAGAKGNLHGANGQEAGANGNLHGASGQEAGAKANLHGANGHEAGAKGQEAGLKEEWKWVNPISEKVASSQQVPLQTKPSGLRALLKRSQSILSTAIDTIRMKRDGPATELCGLRGCRLYIWINAILLFGSGLWILWIWLDEVFEIRRKKYLVQEVSPNWPFFSNLYCFAFCWAQPFLSAFWLVLSAYCCKKQFIRMNWGLIPDKGTFHDANFRFWKYLFQFYIVTPWLLLIPMGYAIFYTFYVGNVGTTQIRAILQKHLNEYREERDAATWDGIQEKYKCCGIERSGWKDWDKANLDDRVPLTCCKHVKKGENCQKNPTDLNTHEEGCLLKIVADYSAHGSKIIIAIAIAIALSIFAVYSATRFYTFVQREENPRFELEANEYLRECICPCTICCGNKDPSRQVRPEPVRTTQMENLTIGLGGNRRLPPAPRLPTAQK